MQTIRIKPDIFLCNAIAIAILFLAFFPIKVPFLQAILGVPFVVFIPGYMVVAALTGEKLTREEYLLFGIGLSLAIVVVSGLLLNATTVGLTPTSWVLWLSTVILITDIIMIVRPPKTPYEPIKFGINMSFRQELAFILAIVIVGIAFFISAQNIQETATKFTQLWLLPDKKAVGVLNFGISNNEGLPLQYRLLLQTLDGETLREWTPITLNDNEQWTDQFKLSADDITPVQVVLFRLDRPDSVYRRVFLQNP